MRNYLRLGAFALIAIGAGCSAGSNGSGTSQPILPQSVAVNTQTQASGIMSAATANHLYIVRPFVQSISTPPPPPGSVNVFTLTGTHAWTVPDADASDFTFSIALDGTGNVYEARKEKNVVAVYPPKGTVESRSIHTGLLHPSSLWLDGNGNLYVTNHPVLAAPTPGPTPLPPGWVSVYAPAGSTPTHKIVSPTGYIPNAIAFDKSGNVYVADGPEDDNPDQSAGVVDIYAPGGLKPMLTISTGVQNPSSIAVDQTSGTVYVGNGTGGVGVYASGATTPSYTLPATLPNALLLDSTGDLYIGDAGTPGGVSEYAPTGRKPLRTMSAGSTGVYSLTLDPTSGNLFAAAELLNSVYIYAPGKTTPLHTISTRQPAFITVGL